VLFQQHQDFRDREKADKRHDRFDPVIEVETVEGVARNARDRVEAHGGQHQADQRRKERLARVDARDAADRGEGKDVEREVIRRAEMDRRARQDRREERQADHRDGGAHEGGDAGDGQRVRGLPLHRHRVAVERGHDRRLVAGDVQQDRADPPAIHAAEIDRAKQDHRRGRIEAEGEGQRDQDRHAVDRPEPGQRAQKRADEAAHQQKADIERRQPRRRSLGRGATGFPCCHPSLPQRSVGGEQLSQKIERQTQHLVEQRPERGCHDRAQAASRATAPRQG
jgi:hypothetical protein